MIEFVGPHFLGVVLTVPDPRRRRTVAGNDRRVSEDDCDGEGGGGAW